ncbi:MAG TPA: DNA gyrase inhibitor YacG [Gemmatales bacterium]|nr:DNA gyrase inhibitor YacG [Gemmatales bacterium]HMP58185.1 DNA gyrase inhibitor YacG [Gemmatales bacterium]
MTPTCPICEKRLAGAPAEWPTFPFCSQRCRLVDLGRWLNTDYRFREEDDFDESGSISDAMPPPDDLDD